jgi:hypothetical protein
MTTPYNDLRLDAGLDNDETVFDDEALDTIWERVSGASNAVTQHHAALALMARQMMAKAASLHDQSVVQSSSKQSQIYDHWRQLYALYEADLNKALSRNNQQIVRSGVRRIPREVDEPNA